MKKNLKKIAAVLVVVGSFGAYALSQRSSTNNQIVAPNPTSSDTNSQPLAIDITSPAPTVTPAPTTKPNPMTPKPVPAPVTKPKPIGAFVDGTYTGNVADAYYGNMQVQAVIKNGALADVVFLQYPSDRGTSVRINTMAMPKLRSEAITAQSSNVNAISGATQSSRGFQETLQSALDQAKA